MCPITHFHKGLLFLVLCSFFTNSLSQPIQLSIEEIAELT